MRRIILVITTLIVTACAPTLQERLASLQPLVGQPEATLIQQFGVPGRVYEAGGTKFLAYEDRRIGFAPGIYGAAPYGPFGGPLVGPFGGGPFGSPYGAYGYGYAAFPPPQVERICETTFEVTEGTIRRVALRGACGV